MTVNKAIRADAAQMGIRVSLGVPGIQLHLAKD
jgi:hypothetical protein